LQIDFCDTLYFLAIADTVSPLRMRCHAPPAWAFADAKIVVAKEKMKVTAILLIVGKCR
jgi:hypothetical protein